MTTSGLINRVMVKLEEYTPFAETTLIAAPQASGLEVKPIRSYIEDLLDDAVNEILKTLPISLIKPSPLSTTSHDTTTSTIYLGDSFLRLHTLKFTEWSKAINVAYRDGSEMAELQKCEWTRGGTEKPVAIYGFAYDATSTPPSRKKFLKYYSVKDDHTIEIGWQVDKFSKADWTITDYPNSQLSEFFAINTAMRIYDIFGMSDKVALLEKELAKLISSFDL